MKDKLYDPQVTVLIIDSNAALLIAVADIVTIPCPAKFNTELCNDIIIIVSAMFSEDHALQLVI